MFYMGLVLSIKSMCMTAQYSVGLVSLALTQLLRHGKVLLLPSLSQYYYTGS